MRTGLTLAALALGVAVAFPAAAQTPCPPDGWFCDEEVPTEEESPPAPSAPVEAPPAAPPSAPGPAPAAGERRAAPPPTISVRRRSSDVHDTDASLLTRRRLRSVAPWGLNVRLQGVLMGRSARYGDAGMGGVGVSLRYQPLPVVALDAGLDLLGGTDYNGFDRAELMWSLSGLLFFNPHMPVKVYAIAGLNMSVAAVEVIYDDGYIDDQSWNYFGGHMGLGLQAEIRPRLALNVDLIGFLRGRTDSLAKREPEFFDSRGRMTNSSGGGLLRGGLTFFW